MEQVIEFFNNFFSTAEWPPRWICGEWTSFHGWLYILSDLAIWLAYFIIPVVIIYFVQKRNDVPFLPVFWLFGAFIILCGGTHLLDAAMFWWPAYRVSALLRFLTAIVSFATVFVLIRDLPKILMKPSNDLSTIEMELAQSRAEVKKLKAELAELKSDE